MNDDFFLNNHLLNCIYKIIFPTNFLPSGINCSLPAAMFKFRYKVSKYVKQMKYKMIANWYNDLYHTNMYIFTIQQPFYLHI